MKLCLGQMLQIILARTAYVLLKPFDKYCQGPLRKVVLIYILTHGSSCAKSLQ